MPTKAQLAGRKAARTRRLNRSLGVTPGWSKKSLKQILGVRELKKFKTWWKKQPTPSQFRKMSPKEQDRAVRRAEDFISRVGKGC